MFRKPIRVKSQVQLKSTEKKKCLLEVLAYFPELTEEELSCLSKENWFRCKVTTQQDVSVDVYVVGSTPMFFEFFDTLTKIPTVYMAWKFPHMLATFTTNKFVAEKLTRGANLFWPGVIPKGLCHGVIPFQKNDPVLVNTLENKSCMAVGLVCFNKEEIFQGDIEKRLGSAVQIVHTHGDSLSKLMTLEPIPELGAPDWVYSLQEAEEDVERRDGQEEESSEEVVEVAEGLEGLEVAGEPPGEAPTPLEPQETEAERMSSLLERCFLKAAKTAPKTVFPILPATFYANHVLMALPKDESLNIKKTRWKKFSVFLQEKALEEVIKVQEIQKNEYKILSVNHASAAIREFVDEADGPVTVADKGPGKPVVQQVFSVTAATLAFFAKQGFKKKDELRRCDVRDALSDYVKRNELFDPEDREMVLLDGVLTDVAGPARTMSRADLLAAVLGKMTVQHRVSTGACAVVHKGKMPLIDFELATRTGNKKVTLISNLESYGVDVAAFAKELQQKAAASTSVSASVPGKKGPQLLVQGNQIAVAAAILRQKNNIQDKFMRGLDKALKPKKDKKK